MELTILKATPEFVRAGYACPCGCTPSVEYARSSQVVEEGCCCGNQFAVGPSAARNLAPRPGYHTESQAFDTPWGARIEAAWLVGPSVHGPSLEHDDHEHAAAVPDTAGQHVDPV